MGVTHRRLIGAALLCGHAGLLAWGATRQSPAIDEVGHMAAGLSHWSFGRFDLYAVNPPLVRTVAALPVWLLGPREDWTQYSKYPDHRSEFRVGRDFIKANGSRSFDFFTVARWMCLPFSLIGGWVCWRWAEELYGPESGLLSLSLWCFCPNILANAQMITPDAGAAALGAAAVFLFWRWLRHPTWAGAMAAGLVLGLAESSKMTWVVLFPLWPVLWGVWNGWPGAVKPPRAWVRQAGQLACALGIGLTILNLAYGFEGSFQRLGRLTFFSKALGGPIDPSRPSLRGRNPFAGHWLGSIPVPLPVNYVQGLDVQKRDFESNFRSYLHGEWRRGGWWYYYLYAMVVKVPLGTWMLGAFALIVGRPKEGGSASTRDVVVLLSPAAVIIILVSSQTGFNHHLRYVLPAFPFLFVAIGRAALAFQSWHRWFTVPVISALAWSILSSLMVYPHCLAYFNELAGGPKGGPSHLLDSNVDWGQDLLYLKNWLDRHPEAKPLRLAYYGAFDPHIAGIEFTLPPMSQDSSVDHNSVPESCPRLSPGWYAVSINISHGYEAWLQSDKDGTLYSEGSHYSYFLRRRPIAWAGDSIAIYHVPPEAKRH